VRCLDNALETDPNNSGLPQAKITNDDGRTQIPDNGRIIRNLIHGADTVMSHILHFYALSAPDFVDASGLGSPWSPTYSGTGVSLLPVTFSPLANGASVLDNYLQALVMRRKAHTMGAILSGRQPIQNALVPGGVTTMPTASDIALFSDLLDDIRGFINTAYIPDVVTVATLCSFGFDAYWTAGLLKPGNCLSYGEYPIQTGTNVERLLLKRGVTSGLGIIGGSDSWNLVDMTSHIEENVDYSYYSSPSQLTPDVGVTAADVSLVGGPGQQYSWLKAPRIVNGATTYNCEVGPLPRMLVSYLVALGAGDAPTVSGAGASQAFGNATLDSIYNAKDIVDIALSVVNTKLLPAGPFGPTILLSALGRHAARALEAKFVADAMAQTTGADVSWLNELIANGYSAPTYVYAKLPTRIKTGIGLCEAPRGALGHWITIENKKIMNYQCVVPTTWNHSPLDDSGTRHGAAEAAVIGETITGPDTSPALGNLYNPDQAILNVLRLIHPYDFCIACAVHIVTPDNKTIAKFNVDLDGRITKLPPDAEI